MPRLLFSLAFFLLAALSLPAEKARTIQLRTLCFQRVTADEEVDLIAGSPKNPNLVTFPLYIAAYSPPQIVEIEGPDFVFKVPSSPVEKPEILGKARLAEGNRQLAFFLPSGKKNRPYKLLVIDESDKAFPMGSTLIYNFTALPARMTIGEHAVEIPSGASRKVPLAKKTNAYNQTTVRFFTPRKTEEGTTWRVLHSIVWKALPQLRNLAIIYRDPHTQRAEVCSFQETPPWHLPKEPVKKP